MKKIAVINDLSGFGKCSLTAALPVISTLGVQACPLPTAILSAQTGFSSYTCFDFTDNMAAIRNEWTKFNAEFNGIYTGFVSCEEQIDEIFNFVGTFHNENTFLLVDPIMGDDGETYDIFTEPLLHKMVALAKKADIITPNITELCLISGVDYTELSNIKDKDTFFNTIINICKSLLIDGPKEIIVTGLQYVEDNTIMIANLYHSKHHTSHCAHPYLGGSYSGTGDLFASCIAGGLAKGIHPSVMMPIASKFLYTAILDTHQLQIPHIHGVNFESHLYTLYELSNAQEIHKNQNISY